jgi:hypothetical protein
MASTLERFRAFLEEVSIDEIPLLREELEKQYSLKRNAILTSDVNEILGSKILSYISSTVSYDDECEDNNVNFETEIFVDIKIKLSDKEIRIGLYVKKYRDLAFQRGEIRSTFGSFKADETEYTPMYDWTYLDTLKLFEILIQYTIPEHSVYAFNWLEDFVRTHCNDDEENEERDELVQQEIYNKLIPLMKRTYFVDLEVSYTFNQDEEVCVLSFHDKDELISTMSISWNRNYNIFSDYKIERNDKFFLSAIREEIIEIAMPHFGKRINELERKGGF